MWEWSRQFLSIGGRSGLNKHCMNTCVHSFLVCLSLATGVGVLLWITSTHSRLCLRSIIIFKQYSHRICLARRSLVDGDLSRIFIKIPSKFHQMLSSSLGIRSHRLYWLTVLKSIEVWQNLFVARTMLLHAAGIMRLILARSSGFKFRGKF